MNPFVSKLGPSPGKSALAFAVGTRFYGVALPTLDRLAAGLQEGAENAAEAGAALGVAVTNLGFALEMYLKSLRLLVGVDVPENHDLWVLYKTLPLEVKASLEKRYTELVAQRDPTTLFTLSFVVEAAEEGRSQQPEFPKNEPVKKDVPNLLRRAGRLAVTWRYPHDSVPLGDRYSPVQNFEHSHLRLFCDALVEEIRARHPRLSE
ncbi:hypothetical protein [Hydrogenophaga sp.]|uniref:hypothetical protein n=1 Tax=Hydrogenophaga sp. TaxID=1904254 RepID=UPI002718B90C|nr:hypothetical protein [Hydrogenophaga sp.]MDO9131797.1 hypothetical protein [Hydrogenophaga sp.]